MENPKNPIDEQYNEIVDLASLLPNKEEENAIIASAIKQLRRSDGASAEIVRKLQHIKTALRNILPTYETVTIDDFSSWPAIDAITMGLNVIHVGEGQSISLPPGTHIKKHANRAAMAFCEIELGHGMIISIRQENFPKNGIRIEPRTQQSNEGKKE